MSVHRFLCRGLGLLIGFVALSTFSSVVDAQIPNKIKDKVTNEAEKQGDKILGDADDRAQTQEQEATQRPGEGPWVNYDFVPGPRVLFFEDFTTDQVGNFPRRLEFIQGNMEVAEWQGRRWLRASARSKFAIPLPEVLPERFTMEFEYFTGANTLPLTITFTGDRKAPSVVFRSYLSGVAGGSPRVSATSRTDGALSNVERREKSFHSRIRADGPVVKVYQNQVRTANMPKAPLGRSDLITVDFPGTSSSPVMLTDIRIGAGGKGIYDELLEKGRVITRGILFDTGSERLRPESTPTLKEMCTMLTEHSELRLEIEGHTDSVGTEAYNQQLSQSRAESVRQFLVEDCGVDKSRLVPKGLGESRPLTENKTPEGRQKNRRVELVTP